MGNTAEHRLVFGAFQCWQLTGGPMRKSQTEVIKKRSRDSGNRSSFSLIVLGLLVLAGVEVNPGPPAPGAGNHGVDETPPPPGPGWIVHDNGKSYFYITPPMPVGGHRVKIDRISQVDKYIAQGIFDPNIKDKLVFSKTKYRKRTLSGKQRPG